MAEQLAVVADWRSRPAKLRPDAARAELVSMNELLGAIAERRDRLVTELPVSEETEPKLEEQLTKLETEVCDTFVECYKVLGLEGLQLSLYLVNNNQSQGPKILLILVLSSHCQKS